MRDRSGSGGQIIAAIIAAIIGPLVVYYVINNYLADRNQQSQEDDLRATIVALQQQVTAGQSSSAPAASITQDVRPTEFEVADLPPTTIPLPPTDTPAPTNTPEPTNTPPPTNTPEPTAVPTPTEVPTPEPKAGDVLYQADWSEGLNGWALAPSWKRAGPMLVSDGENRPGGEVIVAPFRLGNMADYAVEAEIQAISAIHGGCQVDNRFGILVRGNDDSIDKKGYVAGPENFDDDSCPSAAVWYRDKSLFPQRIDAKDSTGGTEWHTYRVEVQANIIRLLIDGSLILEVTDNHYLDPGEVGLWSEFVALNVRSFKVIKL